MRRAVDAVATVDGEDGARDEIRFGDASSATARATSSGTASRPAGMRSTISSSTRIPSRIACSTIGVLTGPGATATTRTPRPPHSTASTRVSPTIPALLAA